jgi:hypothetical protein
MNYKLFILIFAILFISACSQSPDYEIIGDSVVYDDSNVYFNVSPHTLTHSASPILTFESKVFSGDVDLLFGFNTTTVQPTGSRVYNPHNEERSYTCPVSYSYNYTLNPNYFTCYYTKNNNGTLTNVTVFEHSFTTGNIPLRTIYWNELVEWTSWTPWAIHNYEFMGMNKWYVARNINVVNDTTYKLQYDLNIPQYFDRTNNGKYFIAMKPSSETIEQAIANGHFYYLDPWWDSPYLTNNLLAYYNFETNTSLIDVATSDSNGTVNNISNSDLVTGIIGNAYFFGNKHNAYVNLSNNPRLDINNGTINYWSNQNNWNGTVQGVIYRKADANLISAIVDNKYYTDFINASLLAPDIILFANQPPINKWTMITYVFGGENTEIYINGTLFNSSENSSNLNFSNAIIGNTVTVLTDGQNTENSYNGSIDEFSIWNITLSASQISDLYNGGLGNNLSVGSGEVFTLNLTPNIYPSVPTFESTLNCSSYIIDNSNSTDSPLNVSFSWFKNGVNQTSYYTTRLNIANNTNQSGSLVIPYLTIGDTWMCSVYAINNISINATMNTSVTINYSQDIAIYNNPVYETTKETFNLTLSNPSNLTFSNAYLIYNGVSYPSSYINSIINNTIIIPTVTNNTDVNFFWRIIFTETERNTTSYNQTILKSQPINVSTTCPVGFNTSFFFDFADEINITSLVPDRLEYILNYGYSGNSSALSIFGSITNPNNFSVCINASNQYFTIGYGELKYIKEYYTDRSFYIFENTRLTNSMVNNTLYELLAGQATSFLFEFRDTSLNPYAEKYVALLRWYPNLNSYKVVEMGKTDDKGQTIMRVKSEDVDYRVAIYELDGTLIKLLNPVRFACLESPCSYIAVIEDTAEDYTTFDNIQSSLTYDNNTGVWTFTWNDPSQSTQTMNLNIISERADSTNIICSTNASGFTGVITCDTSAYSGTLRGIAYRQASPLRVIAEKVINTVSTAFRGTAGLFISLIIFITLVLIGIVSPIISILMGVVALVPAYFMGSINLVIFVGLAFIGVLVIHFMKRSA